MKANATSSSTGRSTFLVAKTVAGGLAALCLSGGADPSVVRPRHRHHHPAVAAVPAAPPVAPRESKFYPERVEGGVDGNLPFNNQIRKMVDPLNANGAGR